MNPFPLLSLVIMTMLYGECHGQSWLRSYDLGDYTTGHSVQTLLYGGFIASGTRENFGADKDAILIRTDSLGDTIWTRDYNFNNLYEEARSVLVTSDGGYLICGVISTQGSGSLGNKSVLLIKTDDKGDTIWTKRYQDPNKSLLYRGYTVKPTADGGYVICGEFDRVNSSRQALIIKIDSKGDTLWTGEYGGPLVDYATDVITTDDGGYAFVGYSRSGNSSGKAFFVKVDSLGNIAWSKTHGNDPWTSYANGVKQAPDGGYLICGRANHPVEKYNAFLLKTDYKGDTVWFQAYGGLENDEANDFTQTADGGYILCGYSRLPGETYVDLYLVKTDSLGSLEWEKTFGGNFSDFGSSIRATSDGGYIICGTFNDSSLPYRRLLLMKINRDGNIISLIEPGKNPATLVKTIDLRGLEIENPRPNQLVIRVYSDGTRIKEMILH